MSKEYSRQCPDCDGPDLGSLFNKGDGRCRECHGTGVDEVSSIFNSLVDAEKDRCRVCSGTGQCQTCGGTGYEYYDDYDTSTSQTIHSSESSSYGDSYSSSHDHSCSDYSSETTGSGGSFVASLLGIITLIIVYYLLQEFVCNKGSSNLQENNRFQQYENKATWVTCDQCNGRGSLNKEIGCTTCSDSGVITCKNCNGKGDIKCNYFNCYGKGYYVCTTCDGDGEFGASAHIRCTFCNETGRSTCTNCKGTGREVCSMCSGKKELKCNVCSGKGSIASIEVCPACNGSGQIKQ